MAEGQGRGLTRSLDRVAFILSMHLRGSTKKHPTMITNRIVLSLLIALAAGCSSPPNAPQAKPPGFGSLADYPVPVGSGGGPELEYCFHYSKRLWELTSLLRENQITPQKARDVTKASLGSQAIEEDLLDLDQFSRESITPEALAGERFMRCAKVLHLPVEARHHAISQSCFGVLKVPRYVYGLKEQGKTIDQARATLLAANSLSTGRILGSIIDDVYASSGVDQFNGLSRRMFLSCVAAGGGPNVTQQ